jgi:TolB protein
LFTSDRDGNQEIYSVSVDGSGLLNLTNNNASDSLAVWFRGGDWIAFTTNRDGNSEVYVMTAEGENPYNATRDPAEDLSWSWH